MYLGRAAQQQIPDSTGRFTALGMGCCDAFIHLNDACTRHLQNGQTLTVTAGPAFTAKWHAQAHPEIQLRFSATPRTGREGRAEGRLVVPCPTALKIGARFRFICMQGDETHPHIKAFRDYIWPETEKRLEFQKLWKS